MEDFVRLSLFFSAIFIILVRILYFILFHNFFVILDYLLIIFDKENVTFIIFVRIR